VCSPRVRKGFDTIYVYICVVYVYMYIYNVCSICIYVYILSWRLAKRKPVYGVYGTFSRKSNVHVGLSRSGRNPLFLKWQETMRKPSCLCAAAPR
jgi:hypothetical protein